MTKSILALLTLVLLAGCYPRESLEKSDPIMVYDVDSDPETLARCIPRQFSPIASQAIAVTVEKLGFNLTMITGGEMSMYVFRWQIRLLPLADGHTRAEVRSADSIRGPLADEEVINAIQACGNAKLTLDNLIIRHRAA